MAISFEFDGDDVVWKQRFDRPAVYLDTFDIRAIADSDEHSDRFTQGLKARNGTWLLAPISMGEFARFEDPRHTERAERLLARVVPHIYLFQADLAGARASTGPIDPEERSRPPADHRNMDYFSRKWAQEQSFPETFRGVFQIIHENRERMIETLNEVASKLVTSLVQNRQLEGYRRRAKAAQPGGGRTRQRIISGELMRELVLDPQASITVNEAIDLIHAVDAVDYCDLVLLDKAWERRVNALHRRIADAGITMPVARCFSMRNNGLANFLEQMERWPKPI